MKLKPLLEGFKLPSAAKIEQRANEESWDDLFDDNDIWQLDTKRTSRSGVTKH